MILHGYLSKTLKHIFSLVPLPEIAQNMLALGKSPKDVASFTVTQEGDDLFIEA